MAATTAGFAKLRAEQINVPQEDLSYGHLVSELRTSFKSGHSKSLSWRKTQLQQCMKMLQENHDEITASILADHRGAKLRALFEIMSLYQCAEEYLHNLDQWTKPEAVATPMQISPTRLGTSHIRQEPKGVVLVIGPWNGPFTCTMEPMIAAIAAGNCVVVKPSEVSSNSASIMERLIETYFDPACVRCVQGSVAETTALLKEGWDHIFYTGNAHIGRIIMKAAAEHLTPVSLELGGKSPCIVDKSAKMESVVHRIWSYKWGVNVGQICVAPDYVLIHRSRAEEFIVAMKKRLSDAYGANPKDNASYGRVINANHVNRIRGLLLETQGDFIQGSLEEIDPSDHYIPPTIVLNPQLGEPLMTEEIFGPVLAVVVVDSIDEALETVHAVCAKPLALYVYSEDKKAIDHVLDNTLSGGVAVNSSMEHILNPNLPFGGVGTSGMGSYHGKAGFDTFTHKRSVLQQDTLLMKGSTLPDNPTDDMYDLGVKLTVTGLFSETQKRMLKSLCGIGAAGLGLKMLRSRL